MTLCKLVHHVINRLLVAYVLQHIVYTSKACLTKIMRIFIVEFVVKMRPSESWLLTLRHMLTQVKIRQFSVVRNHYVTVASATR